MLNKSKELKSVILGGGAIVTEFYIPALYRLGLIANILVVDNSRSSMETLAKRYPNVRCKLIDFREYLEKFFKKGAFDAGIITLPNCLHAEAVEACLRRHLHVLCEKPLTLSRKKALELEELSVKTGKKLAAGMTRRLLPSITALKEVLKSDVLGAVQNIDIECGDRYAWLSENDSFFLRENGGVLTDMGVHYLDIVEELFGPLRPVSYNDDCQGGVEANCEFNLRTGSDITVRLKLSRTHKLRNTGIFRGERGEAIFEKDTFDRCFVRLWRSKEIRMEFFPEKTFEGNNWPPTLESCFVQELSEFFDAIQNKTPPRVSAKDAAQTISLIEWAYDNRNLTKPTYFTVRESPKGPQLPKGPVALTGGTGFIGAHLVERLHKAGFNQITVPVRSYRTCARISRFPVNMPLADLLNFEEVKKHASGARYIFHLAYGRDGARAHRARITVRGTQNVVNAAIESGAESVVVLSSMYVFGNPDSRQKINEDWPYAPVGGEYGLSKAGMEKWCLKRARSTKKTRIVILNPSCVYGPGGNAYTQMPLQMAKEGLFSWVEDGRGTANYTFVDNLVDAMLLAASCRGAHGERFIINDGVTTWRSFLTPFLGAHAGHLPSYAKDELVAFEKDISRTGILDAARAIITNREVIDILRRTSLFGAALKNAEKWTPGLLQKIKKLKDVPPSTSAQSHINRLNPPAWLADLFSAKKTVFSAEKAKRVLGWYPGVALEEGQRITREWLSSVNLL